MSQRRSDCIYEGSLRLFGEARHCAMDIESAELWKPDQENK